MKDTITEAHTLADFDMAKVMGYGYPEDHPKWSRRTGFTQEDIKKENQQRYLYKNRRISKRELDRFMAVLDTRSKAAYEFKYPRRPKHWDKVISAYLDIPQDERQHLGRVDIEALIEYTSPEATRERRQQDKRAKQAKREAKAKARRVRNLEDNKNQEWNWGEKRTWAKVDDDTSEEDKPRFIAKANKGGIFWPWYNGYFSRFISNLDWKLKHGKGDTPSVKEGEAGSISSSWNPERLAGGADTDEVPPIFNSPEFSSGYGFGYLPPTGKKKSGNTRKLLGEK